VKRILVRAPRGKEKAMLLFPFLHLIKENFIESKIDVVCERDDMEVYGMVDVEATIHNIPESKQTISGIHHYCYNNSDVFNVDLFFDLTDSFLGSFLGFCFRSKNRVGYDRGLKSILINKKREDKGITSVADRYIYLMEEFNKFNLSEYSIKREEDKNKNIVSMEVDPYLIVITNGFNKSVIWKKILEKFSDIKIIVWDQSESETRQLELADMNIQSNLNLVIDSKCSLRDLVTLSSFSNVVLTDVDWTANFLAYKGDEVILLKDRDKQFQTCKFYPNFPKTVYHHDGVIDKFVAPLVADSIKNEQQLVDYIYDTYFSSVE
jgi:ADP-heptose:LPS heptosyltransferase